MSTVSRPHVDAVVFLMERGLALVNVGAKGQRSGIGKTPSVEVGKALTHLRPQLERCREEACGR